MVRKIALCLNCEHRWFTKFNVDTSPDLWQCPKCMGYSCVLLGEYKKDLQHLRNLISPEEAKKVLELYNYAVEHGYMQNTRTREVKFKRLLEDLANPDSSVSAES